MTRVRLRAAERQLADMAHQYAQTRVALDEAVREREELRARLASYA